MSPDQSDKTNELHCKNCDRQIDPKRDRYCPSCGQKVLHKKILLSDLLKEFFSSIIAYDSRLQKSLKSILFKPGKISSEYIKGKRARYVNPFRLFISIALIFFIFFNWFSESDYVNFSGFENEKTVTLDSLRSATGAYETNHVNQYILQTDSITYSKAQKDLQFDDSFTNYFKFKFIYGLKKAVDHEQSFFNYVIGKLPFLLFFFVPLFTLFSRLFYLRKNISYTEHLIFNFYQQSVFFLFLIIGLIVEQLTVPNIILLFGISFSIYNLIAIKRFYQQGVFLSLIKGIALNLIYIGVFLLVLFGFLIVSLVIF